MKKIGLALSGGGFRASLYHLGLVRFLRDAGILAQVSHITAVSGGSIFAAHLALKWDRYNGSAGEFDAAASELLDFVRLDVRNRITRRFPLVYALSWPCGMLGRATRRMTRTGLLEYHYEKYLYGDTSLFQLPERPQLHLLTTNVSEGCLCSFHRNGLLIIRRQPGRTFRMDHVHVGLATVPMAVTASSAFPGFFPPIELTGADVGATAGEFGRHVYTDGGVFDNLGVRMFRFLEQSLAADQGGLDGVLVSDVGKPIRVLGAQRAGGIVRTAMRASEILMDRVWQLENETLKDTPGFVFARITEVVEPHEDLTALHPEIQRQVPNIRTDLDRFTPLEISCLVQHGYCVGRKVCRAHPELFGADLPVHAPWDPFPETHGTASTVPPIPSLTGPRHEPAPVTLEARRLQASALRHIWSTLLDYRDWVSYIYVPILVPLMFLLPYLVISSYQRSHRDSRLIESISHGSMDYEIMSRLLDGSMQRWTGEVAEEVSKLDEPDFKGFEVLQDSRILDLRPWNPNAPGKGDTTSMVYGYRRLKILKKSETNGNGVFRIGMLATSPKTQVRFPAQLLQPKLRMMYADPIAGEKTCRFEASVDFQKVPSGEIVDLIYEHYSPGLFLQRGDGSSTLSIVSDVDTAEVTRWFLMPQAKEYRNFRIVRYKTGNPGSAEVVKGFTEYLADDSTILAYKIVSTKAGYTYDVTWYYR